MGLSALFFLLYLAIVIIIGIVASRKETEEGFMIAERNVHGVQLAATMSAGFFDGATLAVYLAYIYQFGLSAIWLFLGFACGFLVLRRFAPEIKRRADELKVYSFSEYFYRTIGRRSGLMFSVFIVLAFYLLLIINLIVSGKVLSAIFPIPYVLSVAIGSCIILTYLLLAGFKAVVKTDFFQLLIMIVMSLTTALYLFSRTSIPAADLALTTLGAGNLIAFFIIGLLSIIVSPDLWQRIFASRDEQTLKNGLRTAAIIIPLVALVVSIMGLATKQFFPAIVPEDALVTGFSQLLPLGLKEFGMVLLYAVSLSSSDTITFVISSIFTRDLQNYVPRYSEESMRALTRTFMVFLLTLAIFISIAYQNILKLGFALASIAIALSPAIFASFYLKLHDRAVSWSLALSLGSVLLLILLDALNPETALISLPVAFFSLIILQPVFRKEASSR